MASKISAVPSPGMRSPNCLDDTSGVPGPLAKLPDPTRLSTSPWSCNSLKALATVGLDAPNLSTSCASLGSLPDGAYFPPAISASSSLAILRCFASFAMFRPLATSNSRKCHDS